LIFLKPMSPTISRFAVRKFCRSSSRLAWLLSVKIASFDYRQSAISSKFLLRPRWRRSCPRRRKRVIRTFALLVSSLSRNLPVVSLRLGRCSAPGSRRFPDRCFGRCRARLRSRRSTPTLSVSLHLPDWSSAAQRINLLLCESSGEQPAESCPAGVTILEGRRAHGMSRQIDAVKNCDSDSGLL